jgi:hypothetical protein
MFWDTNISETFDLAITSWLVSVFNFPKTMKR